MLPFLNLPKAPVSMEQRLDIVDFLLGQRTPEAVQHLTLEYRFAAH